MGASVIFPSFSISFVLWLFPQSSFSEYGLSPCLFGSELSTSAVGELFYTCNTLSFNKISIFQSKKKKKSPK
jgi:hypothetical protein